MPNGRNSILVLLENTIDMVIYAFAMYSAFIFASLIQNENTVYPNSPESIIFTFAVVLFSSFVHQAIDSGNRPTIDYTPNKAVWGIIKSNLIICSALVCIIAFFGTVGYRTFFAFWVLIYFVISSAFLIFKRKAIISVTSFLRRNQYNLKKTIIVGDNSAAAREYIKQIGNNPGCGVMIVGYVGDKIDPDVGCEKLGSFKDLIKVLDRYRPTDVVFAIDSYDKRHLIKLVNICDDRCIKVYFLPVIYGFFKNSRQIEQIGTIPIINIHSNPLNNRFNALVKRWVDVIGSIFLIILTSPAMLLAVIGIKLTSKGPILFRQERVGMMGKTFTMLKFRSMPVNKDAENNWTSPGDARPNRFGSFIRRTAIDELPQFFNVLIGHMSLVGPRPEIPKFVDEFRDSVPLYMIKHYVKPGVTGLAQIRGLRGDTSLEERIQVDISYIENWSLWLDLSILLKTPFKAFNKYEKYVRKTESDTDGILGAINARLRTRPTRENKPNQKILYVASVASHLDNFHRPYIELLRAEGHTVYTMASGDGVDFNIPFVKKILSGANRLCRKDIREIIKREEFDLIILNTSLAAFHVRLALGKKNRPRTVNIVHGYLFEEAPRGIKARLRSLMLLSAEMLLAPKTDAILTMNDEDLRIATKRSFTRGPIIPTFGMGVPFPTFTESKEDIRKKYAKDGEFVLLFAGELSGRKNQIYLINSMPAIKRIIPKARLWLVGDGDREDLLRKRIGELGLNDSVSLLGRRANAQDFMRACDVYVSASKCEGLPFNIVEALAAGKTVVASRVKGHADVLGGGKGILFDLYKKGDLVSCISKVYLGQDLPTEENILEGYANFSDVVVTLDTYEKIKEASWLCQETNTLWQNDSTSESNETEQLTMDTLINTVSDTVPEKED